MITHLANSRGMANHGWLQSAHTFSFADYYDSDRMNFGALRVINDDVIAAGSGFGRHKHVDMEIITIPMEGSLRHEDSEGNRGVIGHGEVQVMSAGTGIFHSEHSDVSQVTKSLQIWVLPKKLGVKPRYDQKKFSLEGRKNLFQLIVSPDGRDGSLAINQDAFFSLGEFSASSELEYEKKMKHNGVYVFIIRGDFEINGSVFTSRDGVGFITFEKITAKSIGGSGEILIMEVPMSLN